MVLMENEDEDEYENWFGNGTFEYLITHKDINQFNTIKILDDNTIKVLNGEFDNRNFSYYWKNCDQKYVIQNLKYDMAYSIFLETDYWKAISGIKKKSIPFCQFCGEPKNLETHHTDYDIRGSELGNMDTLTVFCAYHHNQFHKLNKFLF